MAYIPSSSRLMKNTFLLYFRMILLVCINLYTSRIVLEALGVGDFGIYNVVGGAVILLGFINSSMTVSTRRYLSFELGRGNQQRLHEVFVTSMNIYIIIAILFVILGETVGLWFVMEEMVIPPERMVAAQWCYHICLFTAITDILSCPYISAIVAHEKMKSFAYIAVLDAILRLLLVYLLLIFDYDRLIFYALLYACEKILIRMVYNIYCVRIFEECKYRWIFNKSLFKEMAIFAGWNMWGNLAYVTYTQGLNMLLNVFFGPIVNAARGVADQVQGTIGNFANNFQMAITPQITKTYASGKLDETHQLIYRGSRLTFCLMIVLCLPIIVETPTILSIWLKEVPNGSVLFLRLLLVIVIVQKYSSPLATAVSSTGRIKKYETLVNGLMLTILPIAYLILYLGGAPWTVFVVYLVIVVIAFGLNLYIALPMMEMKLVDYLKYAIKPCVIVLFLSLLIIVPIKLLIASNILFSVLTIITTIVVTTFFSFKYGLNDEEQTVIIKKIAKLVKR
jgi:O-antigen/teichoic acid export membrane protein